MKRLFIIILLTFGLAVFLFSQDYDVQWVQGDVPVSIMDFRNDTIQFHYINDTITIFESSAGICDKNGVFQFFTNGINVRDRYGNKMPNGDSLSFANQFHYVEVYPNGGPSDQDVLILPKPGSDNLYYIFHYLPIDTDIVIAGFVYMEPTRFYYSVVDMDANMGLGDVIQKNVPITIPGVQCASKMTAVKHANGRDWWLVRHGFKDNTYITYLFTPDSILGPFTQAIGPAFQQTGIAFDFYGNSVFNVQGTQMASVNAWSPTVVLDFDRCSGRFSNALVISNKLQDTTLLGGYGLAFSPSGRFLYVNSKLLLNQYDLWSTNPNDSVALYVVDSTDYFYLHQQRLAPNGKIYISTYHGGTGHLHVINYPDSLGLACGFQFQGQQCLTTNTWNLPNTVNYKLGALLNSLCDTLSGLSDVERTGKEKTIKIFPNPATTELAIDYGSADWSKGDVSLEIVNAFGQIVYQLQQPIYNSFQKIHVAELPNGVYTAYMKRKNQIIAATMFAKQ